MMDGAREWLLAILSACVLCAVAESLMPSGPVKRMGKLVCGLVLLCALLSGMKGLDLEESQAWLRQWTSGMEEEKAELENQVNEGMKVIIEEKFEAYIVDKAAELGLACTAQVSCRMEEGICVPDEIQVVGDFSPEEESQLRDCFQEELGVPSQRQIYQREEALP